jgi:hypothetical protein
MAEQRRGVMSDPGPTTEIVEKAYRARLAFMRGQEVDDVTYEALRSQFEIDGMRVAIQAVGPEIVAAGLRVAAAMWEERVQREKPPIRGSMFLNQMADRLLEEGQA